MDEIQTVDDTESLKNIATKQSSSDQNRQYRLEYHRQYREKNRELLRERGRRYATNHREELRQRNKIWYAQPQNKEWKRQYKKEYMVRNKDRIRQQSKEYRQKNADKIKLTSRAYYDRTKEAKFVYTKLRQRKMRPILKAKLFDIVGGACCCMCGYCKDTRVLQFDHIHNDGYLDRKRFGRSVLTLYRYYIKHPDEARKKLQVVCSNCNLEKLFNNYPDIADTVDNLKQIKAAWNLYQKNQS